MHQNPGAPSPIGHSPPRPAPRSDGNGTGHAPSGPSLIDALAAARDQFATRLPDRTPPPSLRVSPWWLALAAVIGFTPALLAPGEHAVTATLRIRGSQPETHTEVYRRALLDYAWRTLAAVPGTATPVHWSVETPHPHYLALRVRGGDGRRAMDAARDLAHGFVEEMQNESQQVQSTQSEAELLLTAYATELQQRMEWAQAQVAARANAEPAPRPDVQYESLHTRWTSARRDFEQLREQILAAVAEQTALQNAGEPARGLVRADDRLKTLADDATLQQDLKELRVNLSELKLHLLNAGREIDAPLDALSVQVRALLEVLNSYPDAHRQPSDAARAPREQELRAIVRQIHGALSEFTAAWNQEFAVLRRTEADPMTASIIDLHERIRRLIGGFLFDSGQRMSEIRALVRALDDLGGNDARHHVRQSQLLQAFHAAQAAYHRFEFVAGFLETRANFQIDAALRAASGLHRRARQHIRGIDERLERRATEEARREYHADLARVQSTVEELRTRADHLVQELVALQESLHIQAGLSAEFLRDSLAAAHADRESGLARSDLDRLRNHQRALEEKRRALYGDSTLALVDIIPLSDWRPLWRQLRVGLAGALIAVLAVFAGQRLVQRQNLFPARETP